jgi:hypothetical protein
MEPWTHTDATEAREADCWPTKATDVAETEATEATEAVD